MVWVVGGPLAELAPMARHPLSSGWVCCPQGSGLSPRCLRWSGAVVVAPPANFAFAFGFGFAFAFGFAIAFGFGFGFGFGIGFGFAFGFAIAFGFGFGIGFGFGLQEQERFGLAAESLLFEWSKRSNQEKTTPLPRPGCIRHPGSPAVLAPCRPLRNSHIPVLEHARFPLQVAPLLGAPQGTPLSFDPASCLVLEASF